MLKANDLHDWRPLDRERVMVKFCFSQIREVPLRVLYTSAVGILAHEGKYLRSEGRKREGVAMTFWEPQYFLSGREGETPAWRPL
jgi:hypothetical protein